MVYISGKLPDNPNHLSLSLEMKILRHDAVLFASCMLVLWSVWGCSYPMVIQHGGQKLVAPKLGVEEEEIRFLRNVFYSINPVDLRSKRTKGMLALTDDSVVLLKGSLQNSTFDTAVSIQDIDGIHIGRGNNEIQLKLGEDRIALLFVSEGSQKYRDIPTKLLYRMLLADGVTSWESDRSYFYRSSRSRARYSHAEMFPRDGPDNPPTAGDRAWANGYIPR